MAPRPLLAAAILVLALAAGQALPSRIAAANLQDPRIIGGDETTIEQFPYQVALHYFDNFRCGGSILSERFVLTAAHCLYDVHFDWHVAARAGSTYRASGGQLVKASKTVIEPRFTMKKLQYDVGLVRLESPLILGNAVRAVQLVPVGAEPKPGQTITLSGWGVTKESSNQAPAALRTVKVSVVRRWLCSLSYVLNARITDAMFCAAARGRDSCQGDSGGPAVDDEGKQVGVVSFGNGCASWAFPGVYTNLADSEVRAFIDNQLKSL